MKGHKWETVGNNGAKQSILECNSLWLCNIHTNSDDLYWTGDAAIQMLSGFECRSQIIGYERWRH